MDTKTMLLIAFGLAFGLPYITVAMLEGGGSFGPVLVTLLFVAVIFLVIWSDMRGGDTSTTES